MVGLITTSGDRRAQAVAEAKAEVEVRRREDIEAALGLAAVELKALRKGVAAGPHGGSPETKARTGEWTGNGLESGLGSGLANGLGAERFAWGRAFGVGIGVVGPGVGVQAMGLKGLGSRIWVGESGLGLKGSRFKGLGCGFGLGVLPEQSAEGAAAVLLPPLCCRAAALLLSCCCCSRRGDPQGEAQIGSLRRSHCLCDSRSSFPLRAVLSSALLQVPVTV